MAVSNVATTPTTAAASTTDSSALGRTRLAESFDTFLTLLTTQMKNQDPLSPLDSNQFTQQIVQMTGVEQQLASNDLLKQLVANTHGGISTAVTMIGKEVRAVTDNAGLKDGKATWTYNLPSDATDVKLEVLDAMGNTINASAGTDNKAGDHTYVWNGKKSDGTQLADGGEYTLKITAKDQAGKAITTSTYITGVVSSVEQSDGDTYISVNGAKVPWDHVTAITQPAASAPSAGTGATTNPGDQTSSPAA